MFTTEVSVFINRPVQEVYDYASDIARTQEWQQDVIRSEMNGPLELGQTGVFVQKFMGREIENDVEIIGVDPPYELCFKSTAGPISFEGCQRTVEQDDGTLASFVVDAEVGGFFKVAEGMVAKQLESSLQRDLDNLKAIMEG